MWNNFSKIILSNRILILVLFFVLTLFMAWKASFVKLSYIGSKILPQTDSAFIRYNDFKSKFGEDGNMMVLGISTPKLMSKELFNDWSLLASELQKLEGIKQVLSVGNLYDLQKDTLNQRFVLKQISGGAILRDSEMDSIKNRIYELPFYEGLIYNKESHATLMAINFDHKILNTPKRGPIIKTILEKADAMSKKHGVEVHYSGLPFIRTAVSQLVSREFVLFLGLSILVSAIILFIFFRKLYPVLFPIILVIVGVIWSLATLVMFGYEITMLTGLIPPLIVIIGIPNSILLLNKYHNELRKHGDKDKALHVTILRISETTLIANVTAAIGFGVLFFTGSALLVEFGVVAALNVMATWFICLCLIPIIFSYLPVPKLKAQEDHDNGFLHKLLVKTDFLVNERSHLIYVGTIIITLISLIGVMQINVNGYVVDDLPQNSPINRDLKFFEKNFEGILPLEVSIDTRKKNGVLNLSTIKRVDKMEEMISAYPEFSRSVSLNKALKYASQAFYNGNPQFFRIPNDMEKNFVLSYLANSGGNSDMLKGFIDSNKQVARVSFQMADVGSKRMNVLMEELKPRIDSILNPNKFDVLLTGSSIIFSKGTDYMLKHLMESILLAIFLISMLRLFQFRDLRIMFISLLPNIIPLIITAGLMGFFNIPLKPSTILIFTIAFGLASDQTIYFLTRYQQELQSTDFTTTKVISDTIRETGVSMTYIALVLFFGFGIFTASTFGGTMILGLLLSITLIIALVSNLTLLPALLVQIDKRKRKKIAKAKGETWDM
ncbi:MMPL family transporter [Daejeonella sp.]|uniref:efflux RND transporter permease subunit n=1 Tax=Daejeonella sp. TaxID=2805397 RepID=UPI0026B595FA|nr:MMPL family transporter [Daejeonella sp.]HQT23285.1 MMPL family transporter [Daejeonella sp.]HQT58237.1 MMPL family transporter [Daejeonella sp.]